jgi:hypothetical protein
MNKVDPEHHHEGSREGPEQKVEVEHDCKGNTGDHAVDEGVAKECHASNDDPRTHDGEDDRRERSCNQRSLLNPQRKWVN